MNKELTYSKAGVSVAKGTRFVKAIAPFTRRTLRKEVLASVGGFAALSGIPKKYKNPVLLTSTDGIGTKVLLARDLRVYHTVGIDLVAMCVNDILTFGGEPFLFLDYFATSKLKISVGRNIVKGIAKGCKMAGCALVGGETAEMPQVYRPGDFDLSGFCVGLVEKNKIVDGKRVRPGDQIIGIPSSGIHSNGYSLVRAILRKKKLRLRSRPKALKGNRLGLALLKPTKIYVSMILSLLKTVPVHAMAHITGGGIEGNLPRVLPRGTCATIQKGAWPIPTIFSFLQEKGGVSEKEMFRTFNMGLGFILVVPKKQVPKVLKKIPRARHIGQIRKKRGTSQVIWTG